MMANGSDRTCATAKNTSSEWGKLPLGSADQTRHRHNQQQSVRLSATLGESHSLPELLAYNQQFFKGELGVASNSLSASFFAEPRKIGRTIMKYRKDSMLTLRPMMSDSPSTYEKDRFMLPT